MLLDRDSLKHGPSSLWKFHPLLPIEDENNIVSLGEVITPIVRMNRLEQELGLSRVWVKDEGDLPTGSFKARGLSMAISKARELGVNNVCIPSAGNAAGALAAYAARAGMQSHIFVPEDTPIINIKECKAYGANIQLVKGNISDAAKTMQQQKATHPDWFDVSTLKEPYRLEGKKTMGYELAEQFDWNLPDVIFYPTGGGTGLIGMWKAFEEMETMGWIDSRRPKMIAVQTTGCAPIVKAFREHKSESEFWPDAKTVASGLLVPKAFADYLILNTVYKSGSAAISVGDNEILEAVHTVSASDGVFMCPEGAATVVALRELVRSKLVQPSDTVVLFNTAAGNKYPEAVAG